MRRLAEGLVSAGADVIVAGCTEVPLVLGSADLEVPLIDSIDALARATIKAAKG
jgi:aspartate racemase